MSFVVETWKWSSRIKYSIIISQCTYKSVTNKALKTSIAAIQKAKTMVSAHVSAIQLQMSACYSVQNRNEKTSNNNKYKEQREVSYVYGDHRLRMNHLWYELNNYNLPIMCTHKLFSFFQLKESNIDWCLQFKYLIL